MAMKEVISLRLNDEMINPIGQIADEMGVSKQEVIRETIEMLPKFIKLFWDNGLETSAYFFSVIQEKILEKKINQMKKAGII